MTTLNTIGLICPEPIMLVHQAIRKMAVGDTLTIVATDPATTRDVPNFCQHLGHCLVSQTTSQTCELPSQSDDENFEIFYYYTIQKA